MTTFDDSQASVRIAGSMPAHASHADASEEHLGALPRGTMLFEYRIDAVLGHGGFGITYLAEDTLLSEPVAIKEYFPSHTAVRTNDGAARARTKREAQAFQEGVESFLSEARIIARFRHPSIMQVRRFFEANGTGYMVLEFVQGQSLETAFDAGPMPEPLVRAVLAGILDGLEVLHDRAILHRDLKPRNVILRQDGSPVLIDFGAARDFGVRHSASITQIVSPNYSSPEQYGVGQQQGPWSDFYSLGAILYRAVTGKVPVDSLRRLRSDPLEPATEAAAGSYDPSLLRAIDAMLAIDAEERPSTTKAIRERLAAETGPTGPAEDKQGGAAPPQVSRSKLPDHQGFVDILRRRAVLISSVVLVVLMAAAAGVWLLRAQHHQPSAGDGTAPSVADASHSQGEPASKMAEATPAAPSGPKRPADPKPGSSFQDCTDCPTMLVVPAGSFQMGAAGSGHANEVPVHTVTLGMPVAIGQREVTVKEWAACVKGGGCSFQPEGRGPGHDDDAITNLSWLDAQTYVAWLSKVSGHPYRLPSEAEWEYAARGGTTASFWWGDAAGADHANCAGCGPASHGAIAATGSFPPNPFGLYDTAGNAAEWVEDCWTPDYKGAPNDGRPVTSADCSQHVLRGGGFNNDAAYVRSASRLKYGSAVRYYANGFRVASGLGQP